MNKQKALNLLIALAVCSNPELHCDTDCPLMDKEGNCATWSDGDIIEAVRVLNADRRAEPANEPLTCEGCMYFDDDTDNDIPCANCKRLIRVNDCYRRKPAREVQP